MKILYLSRGYSPHDYRFLQAIARSAERTFFGRLEEDLAYESRALPQGVEEVEWVNATEQAGHSSKTLESLENLLSSLQPDLVHAGPIPTVAAYAAQSGFSPLISMSWGSDILVEAQTDPARAAARFTLAKSARAFADCQTVKQELMGLGMPADKIVVFPWGVELEHFYPQAASTIRSELGWESNKVALSTRSLEPQYGLEVVVDGFILAASEDPGLRLLLLGRGSLKPRLKEMLSEAGMLGRVHFAGQIDYHQLPAYYRAADLYITASQSDGSSVSLLEAMACGLPGLISDIPGNREWMVEKETGWLFPSSDSKRLAQGLSNAFGDAHQLVEMGKKAYQVVQERADWKRSVESMFAAYQDVLTEVG